MRIIRDQESATLTLVPVGADEEHVIASISTLLQPEDKLSYGGRGRDGDDDRFCAVYLHAGATDEEQTVTNGNVTVRSTVHVGGVKLALIGTTEADKYEVNSVRNTCFFGSGGLIYLGETEVDGVMAIITTAKRCKLCSTGMIRYDDCESGICDNCAAKCEHKYVRGMVHGGSLDIGVGYFCDICNRGKPNAEGEPEMNVAEHHAAVTEEFDVIILYG